MGRLALRNDRYLALCESNQIFQESKGYEFESETDTETIAKLIKYVFDNREIEDITFSTLVERVIQQLVSYKSYLSKPSFIFHKCLPGKFFQRTRGFRLVHLQCLALRCSILVKLGEVLWFGW